MIMVYNINYIYNDWTISSGCGIPLFTFAGEYTEYGSFWLESPNVKSTSKDIN